MLAGTVASLVALSPAARALDVELDDVAPDRVERQRAYARGVLLPGTPDLARLDARLAAKGLSRGSPVYIRIFKETSELELWVAKGERYILLETYPVCHWTGTLGPKIREGDKQSPEGFYTVSSRQMRLIGRWPTAFNLGFPNAYDRVKRRTGSYILVHGGCSSTGCFAMTEAVQEEIYGLAHAAHAAGQTQFQVHVFPFRMTDARMTAESASRWSAFWRDLKPAYDSFERTAIPPRIAVCGNRYLVTDGTPAEIGRDQPLSILPALTAASRAEGSPTCRVPGGREQRLTSATVAEAPVQKPQPQASDAPSAAPAPAARQPVQKAERAQPRPQPTSRASRDERQTRSERPERPERVDRSDRSPTPGDNKPGSNGLGSTIVKGSPRMMTVGG